MQSEEIFERLTETGVLNEEVEGSIHRVGVTNSFQTTVDDFKQGLDEEAIRESGLLDLIANPNKFLALGDRAFHFAAVYLALVDAVESSGKHGGALGSKEVPENGSVTSIVSEIIPEVIFVLEHVMDGYPRTAGAPEGFLSIGSDQLTLALACFDRVVLYIWRDDCPACDSMATEIEALLETREPKVPLLSLFGPDAMTTLRDCYDVFGAPTTLFIRGGEVESRILGSRHKEAIAGELDALSRRA